MHQQDHRPRHTTRAGAAALASAPPQEEVAAPAPSWAGPERAAGAGDAEAMSGLFSSFAEPAAPAPSAAGAAGAGAFAPVTALPIRRGMGGPEVVSVQQALNEWISRDGKAAGYRDHSLATDGKFGSNTEYVVARFQGAKGLGTTGAVNQPTSDALEPYGFFPPNTVKGGGV